jgi:glycosyltransferase involved in cell wall biosynthesis
LRAWTLLDPDARARAELVVVGEDYQGGGQYRTEMERQARGLGLRARFVGFQKEVDKWQVAASIAVVPSRVEPLGLVALEAMARGVPVVASAVGGIPEVVEHGTSGLLVPPESPEELAAALGRLLNDPDERTRLGRAGRRRCEAHFSLEAHTRAVLTEYQHVLRKWQPAEVG